MTSQEYDDKFLSSNLKRMLTEAGHNMSSLAHRAGLKESTVRNLCDTRTPFNPNARTVVGLAQALDVSISDIITPESD